MLEKSVLPGPPAHLRSVLAHVRQAYFPRWDRNVQWRIRKGHRSRWTREDGYCDSERQTIWVSPALAEAGGDQLIAVVVHEVCHAIQGSGHGRRFRLRLAVSADAAEAAGRVHLAGLLRQDAMMYEQEPPMLAKAIYSTMGDIVGESPHVSFAAALRFLATQIGLTPSELQSRYRQLRNVYLQERRERGRV